MLPLPHLDYNTDMDGIRSKLHISTIDSRAGELASKNGLGVEIAEFCWAHYLDCGREEHMAAAREFARGAESLWFHAPFAEISPCAIDPKVRALTAERYRDSIRAAGELGIKRLVIHGGYIPYVYFPESFVAQSVLFWKEFLRDAPEDIRIALENVMEPDPSMLVGIVREVDDERLGLCLDVGHANCETSDLAPEKWVRPMAPRLFHVHLHDNIGGRDLHLPLGQGNVPFETIINDVVSLAPEATFTIENMDAAPSVEALRAKGFLK